MGRSFVNSLMTATLPKAAIAMAVLAVGLMAQPANTILSEKWDGITGNLVTNLTSNAAYPNSPTTRTYPTLYELPSAAGDNYGTRTRGYVTPPTTGNYTFWIACDDNCELWLGTSNNPATAVKIAEVAGASNWTNSREWTKFASQQSTARSLTAGVQYYIETRHKEGTGGDNLAVGWQGPGITGDAERPIPGSRLAPYIIPVAPVITNSTLTANASTAAAFSYTITATGTAPITYGATPLPAGLSVNTSTGVISGTATTPGTTNVTLSATNSAGSAPTKTLAISVFTPPTITNSTLTASGTVGTAFAGYTITATGTSPITYGATPLPAGLSLNTGTGAISGTPTAAGTTNVTLSATNGGGSAATKTLVITIAAAPVAPVITNSTLTASGTVGTAFAGYTITASGTTPITFGATPLPAGLSVNASTGVISGTPTAAGTTNVTLTATNAAGSAPTKTLVITVSSAPVAPTITNSTLTASGTVGTAFAGYTITASGTTPITFAATPLPAGLSLNTSTGVISGTPTAAGTTNVSMTATNSAGTSPAVTLVITVLTLPTITNSTLTASGTVGTAFAGYTITATGSTPITFGASPLPAGLSVNTSTGVISGTPTATGTTNVTLSATNPAGSAPTRTLAITISAVQLPVIDQQPVSVTLAEGLPGTFTVVASSASPLAYQWKKQGIDIPGATSSSYTIPAALKPENGTVYTCVVSATSGGTNVASVTTNPVEMQVLTTNKEYGTVSSADPLINMNTFYGNGSSGDRKTFKVASSNGASNTGNATSMDVSVSAGNQDAGTVTAASITANDGANSTGSLTGLNINVNKSASSPGSNVAGLKVNVSDPGSLGAYSALFSGGNVGIGTLTPGEALEVVGNLKIGAAMLGRRLELGTEMGDPRGWRIQQHDYNDALTFVRGDGAVAFWVTPASMGMAPNVQFNDAIHLGGDEILDNGYLVDGLADFSYLSGIDQYKTVLTQTGALMDNYYSHLDSRFLLFDEESPEGNPNQVLSSGTSLGNATLNFEKKYGYADDPQSLLEYSLFATPYALNLELWQNGNRLTSSSIGYGGFSTTESVWLYGDEIQGEGYSEMRNTYIDNDDGLRNSWYANYHDGATRLYWSAFDKSSLVMAEQKDFAVSEDIPAGSLDYMHANFLDNNGMHLKTYSNRDPAAESGYKSRTTVDIEGGTIVLGYADDPSLTDRSLQIGALGLHYASTVFGFNGATTDIDDFGITTTGDITAEAIHANTVVTTPTWRIPDYVFEEDYKLQSLESVSKFVEANKHLPNVPSAREIKEKGMDLTEMNIKLLEKVEELTLHMIKMDKELKTQKQKNNRLEKSLRKLQSKAKED